MSGGCVVAGIDGGASRGLVVVLDPDGGRVGAAATGPLNLVYHRPGVVAGRISRGLYAAARAAGLPAGSGVGGVYAGLAGLDAGGYAVRRARAVESRLPFRAVVDHDAFIAWWTAWLEGGGAAVIAGTGSLVFHYDESTGARRVLGDHGPLLGDQGSAFELGFKALRMLGEALQGLRRWGCLEASVSAALGGVSDAGEASEAVYSLGIVAAAARAARAVLEAAESGCGAAASLVRGAGYRLGLLLRRAVVGWGIRVFRVYGGLSRSSLFMESLEASGWGLVYRGLLDPAAGAVWLALQYYCMPLAVSPGDVAVALWDVYSEVVEVA